MIKPFAKNEALLSRSDGVTMVGHDQAPNRCSYGSSQPGPQMKPWHLCRSSGMAMVRVRPSPQVILWHCADHRVGAMVCILPSPQVTLYKALIS